MTREQMELAIMKMVNEHNNSPASRSQGEIRNVYYDCGNLGTLHLYWYGQWVIEWITIEKCPEGIGE